LPGQRPYLVEGKLAIAGSTRHLDDTAYRDVGEIKRLGFDLLSPASVQKTGPGGGR